jgi:hypothetical protein
MTLLSHKQFLSTQLLPMRAICPAYLILLVLIILNTNLTENASWAQVANICVRLAGSWILQLKWDDVREAWLTGELSFVKIDRIITILFIYIFCGLFCDVSVWAIRYIVGWWSWKGFGLMQLLSHHLSSVAKENYGVPDEIQTRHFPKRSPKLYRYATLIQYLFFVSLFYIHAYLSS